jgi:hypothetical protein
MSGGRRKRAGRKLIDIDPIELEKLYSLNCTDQEAASWFGVSVRTIEGRRKQRPFGEVMERGKAKGKISIRRSQMRLVEAGNVTMAIWMGKQVLGQRDVTLIEITGGSDRPVPLTIEFFDSLVRKHDEREAKKKSSEQSKT